MAVKSPMKAKDFDFAEFERRQRQRFDPREMDGLEYMVKFMMELAETSKSEVIILFNKYIDRCKMYSPSMNTKGVKEMCLHNVLYTAENSYLFREDPNIYGTIRDILVK